MSVYDQIRNRNKSESVYDKIRNRTTDTPQRPIDPELTRFTTQNAVVDPSSLVESVRSRFQAPEPVEPPIEERSVGGKVLDTVKAVGRGLSDFETKFQDSISLGLTPYLTKKIAESGAYPEKFAQQELAKLERAESSVGGKIGEFAGYVMPGSAIEKGIAMAAKPLIGAAPKLGARMGTAAAAGATEAAVQELGDIAFRDKSFDPENVALGAGIGGAFPLVGDGLKHAFGKLFQRTGNTEAARVTEEILALPAPRERGNVNTAVTPEVIYAGASPTRTRIEQKVNPYRQKYERLIEQAKSQKFTPGRELEELEELWGRMADRTDPGLDQLIDLAYPRQRTATPQGLQQGRMKQAAGLGPNVERNLQPPVRSEPAPKPEPLIDQSSIEQIRNRPNTRPEPEVLRSEPTPQAADDIIQTKEPRIRDKVVSYLDEQEKAARERLKAKRNTLSSNPIDQYADYAIILAAKAGKGAIKLADATEYLVKEFGEEIRPHVQAIVNRAKSIAREAERRASKEAEEARSFNASDTGDATTFRSKVSRDKKASKVPFSQRFEKLRSQFEDDLIALEGVEKRVRGKLSSAEDSLYKSARLFRGVPEKANTLVKNRLAPIINGIEKKGYTSADLGDYALAVHAKDVNARDVKSGFTNREIDEVINRLGTEEMEAARKELIKISDDMLDELQKNGVISKELVESLRERYPNYMPLFRNFDDEKVDFSAGLSKALANVTSPIKGLKGSERQVVDPMESMVKNIFQSTNAAERNKVARQLSKLAKDDKDSKFIRKITDKTYVTVRENGAYKRYEVDEDTFDSVLGMSKEKKHELARSLSDNPNATFATRVSVAEDLSRKNVVTVLEDGVKVRYEVEPEVYKAMLNLDQESSNTLIKILQKPASLLRAGATLTPEFSLRNPLRDIVQAFVVSESGFNPLIDFPVGLMQSISKGNLYKQWVDELGAYGNIMSGDRQVHREALERVLKESPGKKFVNVVNGKTMIRVLRAISDTTESATKVGEFRAALRKGVTPQEAAYRSRDIMDFGRSGSAIRQTNKIVAFLNANIQGKSKLIRAFNKNPAGFTARAFASVTVPTIGAFIMQKYMANDEQKQTIEESPAWMTDTFWLIPVPGTDQVARIPKPFDLSTLFSNLPERALKYTYNNDKKAFDGFAKKALADGALPGMITGLLPIIEGMANYSFFRGSSIIPRGEEGRKFEDQYDINTTETAKLLAKGAEKLTGGKGTFKNFSSPRVMDNTIKGLTAGLGTYATSAIDVLLDKFNVSDNPVRPAKAPAQQPLNKAFLVNPLQGGKSTEELYELKEKLTREKGSAKLNQRPFRDEGKLKYITNATDNMSDITKRIRQIENSRDLSAAEKRERIEPLIRQRNKIARDTMNRIESTAK